MEKKSLFNRLAKEDEGPTSEDLDRELESAVAEINSRVVETIDAESVLRPSAETVGQKQARVYLFDLAPLYKLINGRDGRLAETLRSKCDSVFYERRFGDKDTGTLEGDVFVMRFPGTPDANSFQRSAIIVNDVGKAILSDQFVTMDIDGLLIVALENDVLDEDGQFNAAKATAAVKSGGVPAGLTKPPKGAPKWIQMRWKAASAQVAIIQEKRKLAKKMVKAEKPRRDPDQWANRKSNERRTRKLATNVPDRRKTFDRRGRGY